MKKSRIIAHTILLIVLSLLSFCYVMNFTFAYELFTSKINISVTANNSVLVTGEEDFSYNVTTLNSSSISKDLFIYRTTDCNKYMLGLNTSYSAMVSQLNSINSSLEGLNYYQAYTEAYFALLAVNESLRNCVSERDSLSSQSSTCSVDRDACQQQLQALGQQYTICSNNLTSCNINYNNSKPNLILGIGIGAVGAFILLYLYNQKKNLVGKGPADEGEAMEL